MTAWHGRSVGMVSSYNGWLWSSTSTTSLCMVIQNSADVLSPMHPRSPSDLLMVHAVCGSHTERCWQIAVMLTVDSGCVAWPTYKPIPTTERQNWAKNCWLIYGTYSLMAILWQAVIIGTNHPLRHLLIFRLQALRIILTFLALASHLHFGAINVLPTRLHNAQWHIQINVN